MRLKNSKVILNKLTDLTIIPIVIRLNSKRKAEEAIKLLKNIGFSTIEITLSTSEAVD